MPYKLQIPDSCDWKKDTDNPMVNGFRELMEYNNQFVDDLNVGIFWYDPEEDELFGVYATLAGDMNFFYSNIFNAEVRTCRLMHYGKENVIEVRIKDFRKQFLSLNIQEEEYLK